MISLNRRTLLRCAAALGGAALQHPPAFAQGIASDPTILTVSGRIGPAAPVQYSRATLETIGQQSFTTKTPWYDGAVTFEGVPMAALMRAVAAAGDRVTAIALNDYTTDIPVSDFAQYGVLLALKRDGQYMPVRDKGPLFIVYPYDSNPVLRSTTYTSRSAWQVSQLIVK